MINSSKRIEQKLYIHMWRKNINDIDAFGQLTLTDYADTITTDISMSYNAIGQVDSVTDASGTTLFSYNDFGQKISESNLRILTHHYDNFGRNMGYSLDTERKASYSFDSNGRMSGMSIGENKDFSFAYLPNTYTFF